MKGGLAKGRAYRGQPLLVLLAVLGGWVSVRAVAWETPFVHPAHGGTPGLAPRLYAGTVEEGAAAAVAAGPEYSTSPPSSHYAPSAASLAIQPATPWDERLARPAAYRPAARTPVEAGQGLAGDGLRMLAALSRTPMPYQLAPRLASEATSEVLAAAPAAGAVPLQTDGGSAPAPRASRWSADSWLLLRRDATQSVASGAGSYGSSQAGAVLRYRLAPSSAFRPAAYARVSRALTGANESEAALGLAARPVRGLPVSLAAEMRATQVAGHTAFRPAAYAVSELPPLALPFGFRGEAYGQAGYVGGDFATGFVDGQARADRRLVSVRGAELRAGGGAWGGAQKGAARLDMGPSMALAFRLAKVPRPVFARVSVDWRFRVAGKAQPASGPALTVSAGF